MVCLSFFFLKKKKRQTKGKQGKKEEAAELIARKTHLTNEGINKLLVPPSLFFHPFVFFVFFKIRKIRGHRDKRKYE